LLYCDTDSVFAAYKENKHLQSCGDEIVWSEVYKDSFFVSPKFYGYIEDEGVKKLKIKGVNKFDVNYDDVKKMFYNSNEIFKITDNFVFEKKNYSLKYKLVEKNLWLNRYDKRVFSENKVSTSPIFLNPLL
jgi:hypothetical protein